jgi:hypothetical protein
MATSVPLHLRAERLGYETAKGNIPLFMWESMTKSDDHLCKVVMVGLLVEQLEPMRKRTSWGQSQLIPMRIVLSHLPLPLERWLTSDKDKGALLILAARLGQEEMLRLLIIEYGVYAHTKDDTFGRCALHHTVESTWGLAEGGGEETVRILVELGADVNAPGRGRTHTVICSYSKRRRGPTAGAGGARG